MKEEVKKLLEEYKGLFLNPTKAFWSAEDLAAVYQINNLQFNENKHDTGCNSCRRNAVNQAKGLYQQYLNEQKLLK